MSKLKKILGITLSILLVFSSIPVFAMAATSYTSDDGYLTYTVSNNKATITDCDTSIGGAYTIPDTLGGYPVTAIGKYAFEDCKTLSNVTIPDSIISIGSYAFEDCSTLSNVTIPDSVTSLGSSAFYNCASLSSITIGNGVTSIGNNAFYSCGVLSIVKIGNNVASIGDYAFYKCVCLGNIIIPDSVISVGEYAFGYCTALTNVTIGTGVTSIGTGAFRNCLNLKSITIPANVTSIVSGSIGFSSGGSTAGFTIYGYDDTAAETYANQHNFIFISLGEYVEPVDPDVDDPTTDDPTTDDPTTDDPAESCSHFCHSESSFVQFFYKIIRFFWKIFGINQYCECGAAHY
ncbi:MAG: leucine-rich repeat domain-containing protein [Clostridiales bacterium]|nr:leucine-rich repeat domain-containing protein [Clostridiales bacterium]